MKKKLKPDLVQKIPSAFSFLLRAAPISLTVLSCLLLLKNLGNQYLWQDEAQTALISKTILTEGVPRGTDGKNFFSQELGIEYGKNYIWKWHTWLPFYVLTAFYKLFGINTFISRLPFALFGVGCVILIYYFTRRLWKNQAMAVIAMGLLTFSIPFLILCRQCRYYSMTVFFSLACMDAYFLVTASPLKKRYSLYFILAVMALFHTHYIYVGSLLAALFLHCLLFHRRIFIRTLVLFGIALILNLPWILWLLGMGYGKNYGAEIFDSDEIYKRLSTYTLFFCNYIFVWPLLGLGSIWLCYYALNRKNLPPLDLPFREKLILLLLFPCTTLILLLFFSPEPYFRYLAPCIPSMTILLALLLYAFRHFHRFLPPILMIGLLFLSFPIFSFLYEITHDYDGPIEGIVKYLNKHAQKDDTVLITYGDMPLKFYTPLRIYGGLTGESLESLTRPDWIIIRKHLSTTYAKQTIDHINKLKLNTNHYNTITIDYPDIRWENREQLDEHLFRTAIGAYRVKLRQRKKIIPETDEGSILEIIIRRE